MVIAGYLLTQLGDTRVKVILADDYPAKLGSKHSVIHRNAPRGVLGRVLGRVLGCATPGGLSNV